MNRSFIVYLLISISQLSFSGVQAQSIADSTLQKIAGERAFYETLGQSYPADPTVPVQETTVAGVKSYWFNQDRIDQKHIVVYLHGGVYALGSINSYRAMLTHLAKKLNVPVLYVEYSLAPEHPFPTANNEVLRVYQELVNQYPSHKISLIGDSAGGGLAITLVHNAQQAQLPSPSSLALLSPWVDLKGTNESYETKQAVDPILSRQMLQEHARYYAPDNLKKADPSELTFKEFPPVLLLIGTDEVLNDDSKNFYAYIKPIQPQAALKEFAGQKHVWLILDISSKESVKALEDIKKFVDTY